MVALPAETYVKVPQRSPSWPKQSDATQASDYHVRTSSTQQTLPSRITVTYMLPLPAAAFVMSPYADLTLGGTTMRTKHEVDPLLSREALQPRVTDYTAGQDAASGLISPVFADLSGLPPLIIQAGTHEVLLNDAVRLARQAATADVEVTLDITPGVPHVFQTFYPILDEATAALDRAGLFLSAQFAGAER